MKAHETQSGWLYPGEIEAAERAIEVKIREINMTGTAPTSRLLAEAAVSAAAKARESYRERHPGA